MELVSDSKEWFELWKKDNITNIISLTKQLSLFFNNSLPDQSFYQTLINNPKEYLSEILGIDIDVDYKKEELEYWNDLLLNLSKENEKYNNFIDYFNDRFNIKNAREMNEYEFVELYHKSNNSYDKWIIKNFFLDSKIYKDTYLYECFEALDILDNKNLSKKIFLKIFDKEEVEDSYLEERRNLLNLLSKQHPFVFNNEFENKYKNIENLNYKVQLKYLTNNTPVEKQKIISIIQENGVENTKNYIKNIYPELYYYLDWNITLSNVDSWITDYFKEYNESKVLNSKSSKLTQLLDEKNHPDEIHNWRYNVKPNSKIKNDVGEYHVWIDGLGAEWLPLLTNLLNEYGKKYGKYVSYKNINSVNLPSATKFNKVDCDYKNSNLDKYIHDNHYRYPNSLIEEIEIIKKIAMDIVSLDYSKISITSDHGFSFLSNSKFGCSKKYNFENAEHGGRYVLSDKKGNDNEDYVYVKTENDDFDGIYAVASKHTSLNNTPSYEVHGGATPEEVLIPQIIIENDENKIDYSVSTELSKINISKDSKLPIKITPIPSTLPIAIFNDEKLDIDKNNDEYYINLDSKMNSGKQSIIIKINDKIIGEITIEIEKGGMKTADDDWF